MRIALTHNLRLSDSVEEAEFDTSETVDLLAGAIERLGHRVERIEVSGPASRTAHAPRGLRARPDLQHRRGAARPLPRGLLPGALRRARDAVHRVGRLGSRGHPRQAAHEARCCSSTGCAPRAGSSWRTRRGLVPTALRFPVMVKPNFEGSSKGITQESVVEDAGRLHDAVAGALVEYPAGVLVEEFIVGRDITVPFLEAAAEERGGVLQPVEYVIDERAEPRTTARHLRLRAQDRARRVRRGAGAGAARRARRRAGLQGQAATVFRALGVRDLGRIDFRLGDDGKLYFLEVNALPSLQPGAGIYASAALEGLHVDGVLGAVIQSAERRWNLEVPRSRRGRPRRSRSAQGRLRLQREAHPPGPRRRAGRRGRVRRAGDAAGDPRGHRQPRPRGDRPGGDERPAHRPRIDPGRRGLQHRRGLPRA